MGTKRHRHFHFGGKELQSGDLHNTALRQTAERKSRQWKGESFYRDLFAEVPIACFSIGVDRRIRAANRHALRLLGYRLSDIIGRPFLELYADTHEGKAKAEEQFLLFRSGAQIRRAELEMRRVDGTSLWIMLSASPIRDHTGQVAASCSVVEEIRKNSSLTTPPLEQDHEGLLFESGPEKFALIRDLRPGRELQKRFVIKSGGTSYFVRMDDIDWVGGAGNYVELHIGKKSYLMRKTMNALEIKLDSRRFLRIHRSAIVNVERIKELRPWHYGDRKIVLLDGTQLTLKRCYSDKLEQLAGESV